MSEESVTGDGPAQHDPAFSGAVAAVLDRLDAGGDAVVIGGPGSGKTTLLREVHARLSGRPGVRAEDIAVLTPSRESADALRDELGAGTRGLRSGPPARSIHSFAFALVSAQAQARFGTPVSFVSGADQDALLAELLAGYESGRQRPPSWTDRMSPELRTTRGFRDQLREALNETMGHGWPQDQIAAAAQRYGRGAWRVVAEVMQDYQDLLAVPNFGGVDTAAVFIEAAEVIAAEAAAGSTAGGPWSFSGETVPRFAFIDAAQDVPDAAAPMIAALRSVGCRTVVLDSPDSASQTFRGARGQVLDQALERQQGQRPIVLGHQHRGAGQVLRAYQDLARRISSTLQFHHVPATDSETPAGGSVVRACVHDSAAGQTRSLTAALRSWHHDLEVPWSQCAVLTRTAGTAAALAQQLEYAGIPVAAAQLPFGTDPATAPLLRALLLEPGDAAARSALVGELLTGPYIGLDAIGLRGLERELAGLISAAEELSSSRAEPVQLGGEASDDDEAPHATPSGRFVDRALEVLDDTDLPAPLLMVRRLLRTASEHRSSDPHTALWALWQTTGVAETWRRRAIEDPASPFDDRLDAVLRLMTLGEKLAERGNLAADAFAQLVMEQHFAQDSLAAAGSADIVTVAPPAAVAHTTFSRVCIVDLDEGIWPNPRVRGTVFDLPGLNEAMAGEAPHSVDAGEYARRQRATVDDEARLLLCGIGRARDELMVCSIEDGERSPSVLFRAIETAVSPAEAQVHSAAPTATAVTAAPGGGTADADPGAQLGAGEPGLPASTRDIAALARRRLRAAAGTEAEDRWAQLLRALQAAGVGDADPARWTSWQQISTHEPIAGADDIVSISPSRVQTFGECRLRWFLTEKGGQAGQSAAQSMGSLIHSIAEDFPHGGLSDMLAAFDERFALLEYPSAWQRERAAQEGRTMVTNLNDFLVSRRADGYELLGVEEQVVATEVDPAAAGPWRIRGRIDRLERDAEGRLHVVDFKTSKDAISYASAMENPQMGTYQVALQLPGAQLRRGEQQRLASELSGTPDVAGGAELVYPKKPHKKSGKGYSDSRAQPPLSEAADPDWALNLIVDTASGMRSAVFPATPSATVCRTCPVISSCPAHAASNAENSEGDS